MPDSQKEGFFYNNECYHLKLKGKMQNNCNADIYLNVFYVSQPSSEFSFSKLVVYRNNTFFFTDGQTWVQRDREK